MTLAIVLTFAWLLGAASYAGTQRLRQSFARRDELDPTIAFLVEDISSRIFARSQSTAL